MQTKTNPANFLLNSVFFFMLLLLPFAVLRLYFYFNYYFSKNSFVLVDFIWMSIMGLRFDLCVIGFLLIPIYLLYLLSYIKNIRNIIFISATVYSSLVLILIFVIFHINIAFMDKNIPFDIPYWMHWPDYRSLFFLDCKICFWEYDYLNSILPLQIVSGMLFLLVLFGLFSRFEYFKDEFSIKREVLFFVLLVLMARGKLGEHHLRIEDSLWNKHPLINTLSNNPLWLIDKIRN